MWLYLLCETLFSDKLDVVTMGRLDKLVSLFGRGAEMQNLRKEVVFDYIQRFNSLMDYLQVDLDLYL